MEEYQTGNTTAWKEATKKPNALLRRQRELRGWSYGKVASELQRLFPDVAVTAHEIGRWERGGRAVSPYYQEKFCTLYALSADQLGFMKPQAQSADTSFSPQQADTKSSENQETELRDRAHKSSETSAVEMGVNNEDIAQSQAQIEKYEKAAKGDLSEDILLDMSTRNSLFRNLQRSGTSSIESGLRDYVAFLQNALEHTVEDKKRRELWRILAQTQLLLRHNFNGKDEIAKAKTWNETAISSAHQSGDAFLIGGAISHLAHLYLMKEKNMLTASQLLESAEKYIGNHTALKGWITVLQAAMASIDRSKQRSAYLLTKAEDYAMRLPQTSGYIDAVFTEFNTVSVDAWAGYCFLNIGEPLKASERLLAIETQDLSERRQVDHFHDIAKAYAATDELSLAQEYSFQSIDRAVALHRFDAIPRFIDLAKDIQKKEPHEHHAFLIAEYAQHALQQVKEG